MHADQGTLCVDVDVDVVQAGPGETIISFFAGVDATVTCPHDNKTRAAELTKRRIRVRSP